MEVAFVGQRVIGSHPSGETPAGGPTRRASILRRRYFIDRFVVALCSICTATAISLAYFHLTTQHALQRRLEQTIPGRVLSPAERAERKARLVERAYPFDYYGPFPQQHLELTWNYVTWKPFGIALVTCGVLAVLAQRYRY